MYSYITTYFNARFAEHAATITGTANDFRKINAGLNKDYLPDPQKDMSYMVKLNSIETAETEAEVYEVSGVVEMFFKVVNKDTAGYSSIIDNYVIELIRIIYATSQYDASGVSIEIVKIGANNLNNFDESGLECQLSFEARIVLE